MSSIFEYIREESCGGEMKASFFTGSVPLSLLSAIIFCPVEHTYSLTRMNLDRTEVED